MVFITPYSKKTDWAAFVALVIVLLLPLAGYAENVSVKSFDLVQEDESFTLNAEFDIRLNPTVEDALNRGVSLKFLAEFELVRIRPYWFNETLVSTQHPFKLSYNALTRQYQLTAGDLHGNFASLNEALIELGRVRGWKVAERLGLKKGQSYRVGIQFYLDTAVLPKPIRLSVLASNEWTLTSGWHYWTLAP